MKIYCIDSKPPRRVTKRRKKITDQKYLSITSLQTDYLNLDTISGYGRNNERAKLVQTNCTFCGGTKHSAEKFYKRIRKDKEKSRAADDSDRQRTGCTTHKCFRYVSLYHLISKYPKPPKYNKKRQQNVRFNERGSHEKQKKTRTVMMITIKRYRHIWNICLVMKNI